MLPKRLLENDLAISTSVRRPWISQNLSASCCDLDRTPPRPQLSRGLERCSDQRLCCILVVLEVPDA